MFVRVIVAVRLSKNFFVYLENWSRQGQNDTAIKHYNQALKIAPHWSKIHHNLATAYHQQGRFDKVVYHSREFLRLEPDSTEMLTRLARILATVQNNKLRDPAEAVKLARRACELTDQQQPEILDVLAVAYWADGKLPQAIETAEKALKQAQAVEKNNLAEEISNRLRQYKNQIK